MKKLFLPFAILIMALALFSGCDSFKNEDNKIRNTLIGKFYEDDLLSDDGINSKNIKGEYYKNGKFRSEVTLEFFDDKTWETIDLTIEIRGDWRVKDMFIFFKYDFHSLKITPDYFTPLVEDDLITFFKDYNTPLKVISYDAAKIIYEDNDGEWHIMKKSY